ncbi:hypothetical protein FQN54_004864 [Arachnomyces sp. PD_36]|nr:hypothetical protein FQN54_004864 [Arachnomyces sp. PD_36]
MAATQSVMVAPAAESTEQATELLWQDAITHLAATNNEILLPRNIIETIGEKNVTKIKARLCALLNTPVVGFVDDTLNAFRIMRSPSFSGPTGSASGFIAKPAVTNADNKGNGAILSSKGTGKPASDGKSAKVPRPPNAFILYRQHYHPVIKEEHPEYHNNDISVLLGKKWKAETDEVKAHFKDLADKIKRQHAEDHPDYQYAPRKPSEKKRRATIRRNDRSPNQTLSTTQSMTQVTASSPPVLAPQPQVVSNSSAAPATSSNVIGQNHNVAGNGVGFNFGGNGAMTVTLPIGQQMASAGRVLGHHFSMHSSPPSETTDNFNIDYLLGDYFNGHGMHAAAPAATANTAAITTAPAVSMSPPVSPPSSVSGASTTNSAQVGNGTTLDIGSEIMNMGDFDGLDDFVNM